jgi:hypothetical protein
MPALKQCYFGSEGVTALAVIAESYEGGRSVLCSQIHQLFKSSFFTNLLLTKNTNLNSVITNSNRPSLLINYDRDNIITTKV